MLKRIIGCLLKNKEKTNMETTAKEWQVRERHNLAVTFDVTAKPCDKGGAGIMADYGHIYLFDGLTAQVVEPKLPTPHDWTSLFFRLIVDERYVLGAYTPGGDDRGINLRPFLIAPMIFDLPVEICVPNKSRLRVELYNGEDIPVTIRFTFVGKGERDVS